jgi:hypothetical protein
MKNLHAPLRTTRDWKSYASDKTNKIDNHVNDAKHLSPFYNRFDLVKGFVIDPMHTVYPGNYGRRIIGFVEVQAEGKLGSTQLKQVDAHILLFQKCKPMEFDRKLRPLSTCVNKYKHHELREFLMYYQFPIFYNILTDANLVNIMRLQQGMILLGGDQLSPVPLTDTQEARKCFRLYQKELMDTKIPGVERLGC